MLAPPYYSTAATVKVSCRQLFLFRCSSAIRALSGNASVYGIRSSRRERTREVRETFFPRISSLLPWSPRSSPSPLLPSFLSSFLPRLYVAPRTRRERKTKNPARQRNKYSRSSSYSSPRHCGRRDAVKYDAFIIL